ncbi:MAG TPA: BamA/TamA family outer membrane protein [Bryobacteraceae bacterium]|nr:BamA/TamA family outer membrane protein [Bryobacteraceae bacterium]
MLLFGWAQTGSVQAQTSAFEGKRIVAIAYQPDPQPLSRTDLARVQVLQTGEVLKSADVAESIDRMFATGRYQDIQVDAENSGAGVRIRFITQSTRFVGHVQAIGKLSAPPRRGEIVDEAHLDLGTPFQPEELSQAEKNIKQLFTSNGLYEATVRLETVNEAEAQQVNVNILVDVGKRARYEAPAIRGDPKLPDATIIRATGWRIRFIGRWRQVTQSLTQLGITGIEKKYQKQDRLTASVNLTSLTYDPQTRRAKPELNINAGPKITIKALEAKVSKRKLNRYVPVYQEGALDDDLLVAGARNLRDYFQSKGYPDVDVTFRRLPPENDQQTVEYFISRGKRQKLAHLTIKGNKYFTTSTIRERMFLEPSSFRFRWGRYSDVYQHQDEETIAGLYKSNGFRNVRVTSAVQNNYQGKANQIAVTFTIDEGPQWLVAHLAVNGIEYANKIAILSMLSSSEGEPYSDANVAADRSSILTYYYSTGFPHASFQWSATPAPVPHEMNLTYSITEGQREYIRDVLISGLKVTRPKLVNNNLNVRAGDPLSPVLIQEAQRQLYDLGIFSKIDTAIQNPNGDETRKYVLYDFDEASRYTVNIGLGAEVAQFGATTNALYQPAGAKGFSPRFSLDVNRLNFFGLGHTLALQTRVSNLEQRAGLSYVFPKLANIQGLSLTITGLYDVTRDVTTFSSHREEASVQISRKFSRSLTASLRFAYRRVSTSNVVIPTLLVPQLLQPVRIGELSGSLVQDRRDNPADAHHGIYNTVDMGLASNVFGSQRNFARVLARNATYYPLRRNLILARQTTVGALVPFNTPAGLTASDAVPLPERFFGGGSVSDRGFPENGAGPRDIGTPAGTGATPSPPTGFPLGGNALLFNNVELRFPLLGDNIGGVLFEDAGNIYTNFTDISFHFHQHDLQDFNYMVHAVGFGIRYKTPLGPVRVDLAYAINPVRFVGFKGTLQDLLACNPNLPPTQLPGTCTSVPQSLSHFQFFFSIGQAF